jgi:cytochrome c oxidase cbb3-type subunit 4
MDYATAAELGRTWGLILMCAVFAGVLAYALWPRNRAKFERAARIPLAED